MRRFLIALAAGIVIAAPAANASNIMETARGAGVFNTLLKAAAAAGLDTPLANDGPLTVFAPTDEAFAKLPAGTVEDLLKPESKDQLAAILSYHVVPRKLTSNMLPNKRIHVRTIKAGGDRLLSVTKSSSGVTVDEANVIDKVMLPKS